MTVMGDPAPAVLETDGPARVGVALLRLQAEVSYSRGVSWVHRRIDQLKFLDTRAVRWRVSVDFDVPATAPITQSSGQPLRLVPVTSWEKGNLVAFDFRDEQAAAVPMLTAEQTSSFLVAGLCSWASIILSEELPQGFLPCLKRIVSEAPDTGQAQADTLTAALTLIDSVNARDLARQQQADAERDYERIKSAGSGLRERYRAQRTRRRARARLDEARRGAVAAERKWQEADPATRPAAYHLLMDDGFRNQLKELTKNFVVLAALPSRPGARRILKLAFEDAVRFRWHNDAFRRLGQSVGWLFWRLEVQVGGRGGSHHLEVAAPPGVDIVKITLQPSVPADGRTTTAVTAGGSPHVPIRVPAGPSRYKATIFVRVSRPGWLTAAVLVAFVIAVVMTLGRIKLTTLFPRMVNPGETQTAALLLLALLGVFATMLVRPGEHPLAARLLVAARVLILADVAALLVGVGDLVLHISKNPPFMMWWVLAGVSLAVAVLLIVSWLTPRARRVQTQEALHTEFVE
jgi:hypothetical protein